MEEFVIERHQTIVGCFDWPDGTKHMGSQTFCLKCGLKLAESHRYCCGHASNDFQTLGQHTCAENKE